MDDDLRKVVARTQQVDEQSLLFPDLEPSWRDYWWQMPSFEQGNAKPFKRVTVSFMTRDDMIDFAKAVGIPIGDRTDSIWFPIPDDKMKQGSVAWDGPKVTSRYPICIPSKGRYDVQRTGKVLDAMGVDYKFFVEETEGDLYKEHCGEEHVEVMPFHDLGQGSIPARNYIWDWAQERGHARHWCLDDNIIGFGRCTLNRRVRCRSGAMFSAMEDFIDRYENIAMMGPHEQGFVMEREANLTPVLWNTRVYSCICIRTDLPYRWRGRYNEDTDLSLRALKDGWCTGVFRALLMNKMATVGVRNAKALKGGNTDNVYNTGDRRKAFAESLQQQHPDVVKVVWKWERWHHEVDYGPFKRNRPVLCRGVVAMQGDHEYGMHLVRVKECPEDEYEFNDCADVDHCDTDKAE